MANDFFLTQSKPILISLTNRIRVSLQTAETLVNGKNENLSIDLANTLFKRFVLMRFLDLIPIIAEEGGFLTLYQLNTQQNQIHSIYEEILIPCWHATSEIQKIPHQFFLGVVSVDSQKKEAIISKLHISNDLIEEIIHFFQRFEWKLQPDLDLRSQNSLDKVVDPTILGRLCEQNVAQSETGSFYTPSILAEYMVSSTIDAYWTEKINQHFGVHFDSVQKEIFQKTTQNDEVHQYLDFIRDRIWPTMTICDNSCGAGQFLVSTTQILDKILNQITRINLWDIIISHIYGVDLQTDAIETTRYRLFLQCFTKSESNPKNISEIWHKIQTQIKHGNAVIGYTKIPVPKTLFTQDYDFVKQVLQQKGNLDSHKRVQWQTELQAKLDKLLLAEIRSFYASSKKSKEIQATVQTIFTNIQNMHWFHWVMEFPDILENGGFDLIIGNPPYLSYSSSKVQKDQIQKFVLDVFYPQLDDLYETFVQKAKDLCKGLVCYIIPTSFYKQIGSRMTQNLRMYENLGENVFKGVNASFCIVQFDNCSHTAFTFRNYLFQDQKLATLGQCSSQQVTNFSFYLDHPILQYIDQHSDRFETYNLQVKRGEEFGRKNTRTEYTPDTIPIFSAEELMAFKLRSPSYFIQPELIEKEAEFYNQERIGVNLAFRHKLKAAYIGKVYSLKSIISIYNSSYPELLEILGWLNSTLFDWYHRQRYCTYTELRANQIKEIKSVYPLKITNNLPLIRVVEYLIIEDNPNFRRFLDALVYDQYLYTHFFNTKIYSENESMLKRRFEKYCIEINIKTWLDNYMQIISKSPGNAIEKDKFDCLTQDILNNRKKILEEITTDETIGKIIEQIQADPWILEIEHVNKANY